MGFKFIKTFEEFSSELYSNSNSLNEAKIPDLHFDDNEFAESEWDSSWEGYNEFIDELRTGLEDIDGDADFWSSDEFINGDIAFDDEEEENLEQLGNVVNKYNYVAVCGGNIENNEMLRAFIEHFNISFKPVKGIPHLKGRVPGFNIDVLKYDSSDDMTYYYVLFTKSIFKDLIKSLKEKVKEVKQKSK